MIRTRETDHFADWQKDDLEISHYLGNDLLDAMPHLYRMGDEEEEPSGFSNALYEHEEDYD